MCWFIFLCAAHVRANKRFIVNLYVVRLRRLVRFASCNVSVLFIDVFCNCYTKNKLLLGREYLGPIQSQLTHRGDEMFVIQPTFRPASLDRTARFWGGLTACLLLGYIFTK